MRKLKLQMQVTVDGCVAGPEGQLDWMTFDMDAGLLDFMNRLTDTSDTILLGRKRASSSTAAPPWFAASWTTSISAPPPDVPEVLRVRVDDEGREIGANPA